MPLVCFGGLSRIYTRKVKFFIGSITFAMMTYSWKDRLRNFAGIQRAGAFAVTLIVIILFLPKESLFKYEYQVNQPWKHEKLLAPFDFGIQKSAEEIAIEKESIRSNQPLVFTLDSEISNNILSDIERTYIGSSVDTAGGCDSFLLVGLELCSRLLNQGLIERNSEAFQEIDPFDDILLYKNNQLVRLEHSKTISIQQFIDSLNQLSMVAADSVCSQRLTSVMLTNLRPNALYDDSLTQRLLFHELESIITIEGKVSKGTTIIDKGDIVTSAAYKTLESLRAQYQERTISDTGFQWAIIGQIGAISILLGLLVLFVYMNQNRLYNDPRPMTLTLSLLSVSFAISLIAISSSAISIYAIPIGITPLLLRMFYDFRVSIFTFVITILIVGIFTSNPLEYIVIQLSAISFATLYQAASTKRSRMLGTALLVFIGYSIIYTCISVAQDGTLTGVDTTLFGWFAINALLCTLVFPLIYIVEKMFGYISETTLLELSDSNQPLLKELAIKAPGTFQHSLQVANLCEKIANKIGGNTVLLRTAAMYHDVGKMNEPKFFIENQLPNNNPHDDLEPEESAMIIVNHVHQGVEMCRNQRIPIAIIQFIQTHHGKSQVRFFLKKAQQKAELAGRKVDINQFSYPGPLPKTKEHAILMMADTIEAASRSLKKYDNPTLDALVDRLVDSQREDGQFDEAQITLKDISDAKAELKLALHSIYHQRISYD